MAIDNFPYVGGMDKNVPANSDPRAEGAGQIRAVKTALTNTFPNVTGEVTSTHTAINYVVGNGGYQVGMTMMWQGTIDTIPNGWALSDGGTYNSVQTANLSGMFLVGYDTSNDDYSEIGSTGGSNTVEHSHTGSTGGHAITVAEMAEHTHDISFKANITNPDNDKAENYLTDDNSSGAHNPNTFVKTTEVTGSGNMHDHTISIEAIDNRPEYYAIAYIVFVGIST